MAALMSQSPPEGLGRDREVGPTTTAYFNCLPCKNSKKKCTREQPTCLECAMKGHTCAYPPNPDLKLDIRQSHLQMIEMRFEQLTQSVQELRTEVETLKGNNPSNASHIFDARNSSAANWLHSNDLHNTVKGDSIDKNTEEDFVPAFDSTIQPRHVTEAACIDFSSLRLRQFLSRGSTTEPLRCLNHFDSAKIHRSAVTFSIKRLPPADEAQRLVKAVLAFIGPDYHLIPKISFLSLVENTYRLKRNPNPAHQTLYCRMFAVFALGELYSLRPRLKDEKGVPGCAYFEYAIELFRDLYEEPTIEYIETILLLAFYEYALNNRNSAYIRAGLALRLSLTLRLHRQPPENCSPRERAHRARVWSTVYILDRISSSKVGLPVTIRDEDIDAPIPSLVGLTDFEVKDSYGHDHVILILQRELARITGDLLNALYRTTRLDGTNDFLQKVKKVVLELTAWRKSLPPRLEFEPEANPPYSSRSVASLHLNFSQCVILTTRSIFFYIFTFRTESTTRQRVAPWQALLPGSEEFSETCVNAARQSSSILIKLKDGGNLALYGFFDALAVFSSALILMMSSTVQFRTLPGDDKRVEALRKILEEMRDAGNMSASDYYQELIKCKHCLEKTREQMDRASDSFHVTTSRSDEAKNPIYTNLSSRPSQSDGGAEQNWHEQMNISDLGYFDTSTLLDGELQAVVQDTDMLWDVNPHELPYYVFPNSGDVLRDLDNGIFGFP